MTTAPTLSLRNYNITLPPLHKGRDGSGGQQAIEDAGVRFEVIICGRRWGKTTYGVRKCVREVLTTGGLYWWVAPTYGVALPGWLMLRRLVLQLIDAKVPGIVIHESERRVEFPKGEIWVKSSDNPDSLRGHALRGVVLDEPGQIKRETWFEVLQPALTDYEGWATFIGTPKGRNWLYEIWNTADTEPGWARWRRFTTDNPYIKPEEVLRAKLTMSDESFRQEYEADFGASSYLVFPEFEPLIHKWVGDVPKFESFHGALDFGGNTIGSHKSAAGWGGITAKDELIVCRVWEESGPTVGERQLDWMAENDRLVRVMGQINQSPNDGILWHADKTQVWGIQLVRSMGYRIIPTKGGRDSVEQGIDAFHRRLQARIGPRGGMPQPRWFYLPECAGLIEQHMTRYRYDEYEEGTTMKRHPVKVDDDLDDMLRYMVEGADRGIIGDPNVLYKSDIYGLTDTPRIDTFKDRMKKLRKERENTLFLEEHNANNRW